LVLLRNTKVINTIKPTTASHTIKTRKEIKINSLMFIKIKTKIKIKTDSKIRRIEIKFFFISIPNINIYIIKVWYQTLDYKNYNNKYYN
jgi:hypothetical protein